MTTDDTNETRSASSGTTRTPPPRTRRGAPTSRSTFDELDALDALLEPSEPSEQAEVVEPEAAAPKAKRSRGSGTRGAPQTAVADLEPKPAPGTGTSFDWGTTDDVVAKRPVTNRDATVLAAAAVTDDFGDPLEPEVSFEPSPAQRKGKTKAAKRPERRFRQTITKVDLWSVTKMALCFYVSAMGVVVVSLVALWVVADSVGIINNVETFIGDLFSSDNFHFVSGQVLRGAVLIGVVVVALMVAFTIIAASFYNIFAELFGGIEVVIREEEQPPKR